MTSPDQHPWTASVNEHLAALQEHLPQANELQRIQWLAKQAPELSADERGIIANQDDYRQKAAGKFCRAEQMLFTRTGLQQSSSEALGRVTAKLFEGCDTVIEVCGGIGGNSLGLSQVAKQVIAYESDETVAAVHAHNMRVNDCTNVITKAEAFESLSEPVDGFFADPDRRSNGKRMVAMDDLSPGWNVLQHGLTHAKRFAVKMSPMLNASDCPSQVSALYMAEGPELKQCVWLGGELRSSDTQWWVLDGERLWTQDDDASSLATDGEGDQHNYLHTLNPAISKAGVGSEVAKTWGLRPLRFGQNLWQGPCPQISALCKSWRVIEEFPFHQKKLKRQLQKLPYGRYELKSNGIDAALHQRIEKMLPAGKGELATLFIVAVGKGVAGYVTERVGTE